MPKPVNQIKFFEDDYLIVREPQLPLAPGAIEIVLKRDTSRYHSEAYKRVFKVYQNLRHYWTTPAENGKALALGLYYLERHDAQKKTVCRQIIPYTSAGIASKLRQVQVAWNLVFPSRAWTKHQILGNEESIRQALIAPTWVDPQRGQPAKCPFCREERKKAQEIVQGKNITVWHNIKELTHGDLLFISLDHEKCFSEKAFVETMCVGRKILAKRAAQGEPIGHLNYADHAAAGQTVPHAHTHGITASNERQELVGVAKVVRRIVVDSWAEKILPCLFRYSDKQLVPKIAKQRNLLQHVYI